MNNLSEPIYDIDQLAQIEEQQTEELVSGLVECILSLCGTVANLREEVNGLVKQLNPQASPAYYELHSDLYRSFEDSPAYLRFEKQLSRLIYD